MLSVTFRIDFKILLLVYKSLSGQRSRSIADMVTEYKSNCPQIIRIKSVEIARNQTRSPEEPASRRDQMC